MRARSEVEREPIAISVNEALRLVPVGRSTLNKMMQDGRVKSEMVAGVRAIDYRSLKRAFAPKENSGERALGRAVRLRSKVEQREAS